ncbi:hypothetical protein LBMAG53_00720 [Planctomycetota bacterium]|nr:hypothetical protein LBMAG53_00720 [Planctomycetota bacterium]
MRTLHRTSVLVALLFTCGCTDSSANSNTPREAQTDDFALVIDAGSGQVRLGQRAHLTARLTNRSGVTLRAPRGYPSLVLDVEDGAGHAVYQDFRTGLLGPDDKVIPAGAIAASRELDWDLTTHNSGGPDGVPVPMGTYRVSSSWDKTVSVTLEILDAAPN